MRSRSTAPVSSGAPDVSSHAATGATRGVRVGRHHAGRRGFTLVELLIAVVVATILLLAFGRFSLSLFGSNSVAHDRASLALFRQRLDQRMGEIARIAPQYGDLATMASDRLAFRKRQAPSAAACGYGGGVLHVRLFPRELAALQPGDSLAVVRSNGTPDVHDDAWVIARLTTITQGPTCDGQPTIDVPLAAAPPDGAIAPGATVRLWSTRSFSAEALAGEAAGTFAMVERVNGQSPATLYGPFQGNAVFTYLDAAGAVTADAAQVRRVRATFTPLVEQDRDLVAQAPDSLLWPVGGDTRVTAGQVPVSVTQTVTYYTPTDPPEPPSYCEEDTCFPPETCPWDSSLPADDGQCQPPSSPSGGGGAPAASPCPWDSSIPSTNPSCVPPPPPPGQCQWWPNLSANDPGCAPVCPDQDAAQAACPYRVIDNGYDTPTEQMVCAWDHADYAYDANGNVVTTNYYYSEQVYGRWVYKETAVHSYGGYPDCNCNTTVASKDGPYWFQDGTVPGGVGTWEELGCGGYGGGGLGGPGIPIPPNPNGSRGALTGSAALMRPFTMKTSWQTLTRMALQTSGVPLFARLARFAPSR